MNFHHLGIAVASIEAEVATWRVLGYVPEGEPFEDPEQSIRGLFMVGDGPRVELLQGMGERNPIDPWLKRGVKCYHHAYEVERIDLSLGHVVSAPRPSVVFGPRYVAFVLLANRWMVELIGPTESQ